MSIGVVYIVDDDEAIRTSLAWLLESDGFAVSCHESGERFLKAIEAIRAGEFTAEELQAKFDLNEVQKKSLLLV